MAVPWWQSAVVYQIYPRSFCDTNGDGVGDLEGVRRKLDYLQWLGVDALWLSPFFRSPMKDYGYDVSDYCDVDPLFGSLSDFDRLLGDAHARGIKLLIDWVPNHTSDQHPWFVEARQSRQSARRDWYVWRDGSPDQPPNNWRAAFAPEPAWTFDHATGQWYLRLFLPEQPDLNWRNPAVVRAMHDTLRFWLDRGVDGFRMDVIHCIGKPSDLADAPAERAVLPYCALNHDDSSYAHLRGIRSVLDEYPGDRVMVGEVVQLATERVASYVQPTDGMHLSFNFLPLYAGWDATTWRRRIDEVSEHFDAHGRWPTWVLSNHDNPRHRTRYGGSEARARAAAVLLLGLRGTPFLYAGEELGLEDAVIAPERRLDPGGRDGCRAPIPWDGSATHGWATRTPWLPWPPQSGSGHAAAQREDAHSVLQLYRRLLGLRREHTALSCGSFRWLASPNNVLAFEREADGRVIRVLVAMGEPDCPVDVGARARVLVASDRVGEGEIFTGQLGADRALLLEVSA